MRNPDGIVNCDGPFCRVTTRAPNPDSSFDGTGWTVTDPPAILAAEHGETRSYHYCPEHAGWPEIVRLASEVVESADRILNDYTEEDWAEWEGDRDRLG